MSNQKYLYLEIEGIDYSKYLSFPYTRQETAKDQLNTALITLYGMPTKEPFAPFSRALLGGSRNSWVIANDNVKKVLGRSVWNHELTLIDATKMTERILMEAKSFTQPVSRDSSAFPDPAGMIFSNDSAGIQGTQISSSVVKDGSYVTPVKKTDSIYIYPLNDFSKSEQAFENYEVAATVKIYYSETVAVTPYNKDIFSSIIDPIVIEGASQGAWATIQNPKPGIYTIHYVATLTTSDANVVLTYSYYVPIAMVDDNVSQRYYSLRDVTLQLLQISEPIFDGEKTRYGISYNGTQGDQFNITRSPEFHFSNGRSLYENLREIGRTVHCIPRVEGYDKITFRQLGSNIYADTSKLDEFAENDSFNVEDYASTIESNFANLINAENEIVGSVVAPYADGYQSLRAVDGEFRITDTTGIIKLPFKVAKAISLKVQYYFETYDITKFLFEKEEYDSLSGFSGVYPYSKTHAIYYTKGSDIIDGLWFRASESSTEIGEVLKKYSIYNILNSVSGKHDDWDIQKMTFQFTFVPIIEGRARQEKIDYEGMDRSVLAYNQTASELSAKAFGENLRGQIAMLGTASINRSFLVKDLVDVPEPGLLFDEDNYITQVTTRVFRDHCVCEIGLTQNYNEISSYTELKTGIRQYEIPTGQDRHTLIENFCVIGKEDADDLGEICCTSSLTKATVESFGTDIAANDVTSAFVTTKDKEKNIIAQKIALPVYSTALGTSVYFGFSFADNYSAGDSSVALSYASYRGTQYVSYGDNLARATFLNFQLCSGYARTGNAIDNANNLPDGKLLVPKDTFVMTPNDIIWHKDSADIGNVAFQLHFVTNDGWIITSELASMMNYVQSGGYNYSNRVIAYFYDSNINKITGEPNIDRKIVKACEIKIDKSEGSIEIIDPPKNGSYSSIVLKRSERACIIGKNTSDLKNNKIYFSYKRRRRK